VPEDHGTPGTDEIQVLVPVDVPNARPFRLLDERRGSLDSIVGSRGAIHPTGKVLKSFLEGFLRLISGVGFRFHENHRSMRRYS